MMIELNSDFIFVTKQPKQFSGYIDDFTSKLAWELGKYDERWEMKMEYWTKT
jgi:hypothetical protein